MCFLWCVGAQEHLNFPLGVGFRNSSRRKEIHRVAGETNQCRLWFIRLCIVKAQVQLLSKKKSTSSGWNWKWRWIHGGNGIMENLGLFRRRGQHPLSNQSLMKVSSRSRRRCTPYRGPAISTTGAPGRSRGPRSSWSPSCHLPPAASAGCPLRLFSQKRSRPGRQPTNQPVPEKYDKRLPGSKGLCMQTTAEGKVKTSVNAALGHFLWVKCKQKAVYQRLKISGKRPGKTHSLKIIHKDHSSERFEERAIW